MRAVIGVLTACGLAGCGYGSYVRMPESACRLDFCRRAGDCCPTLAELDGTVKPRAFAGPCVLLENGRVLCAGRNVDGAAGIGRVAVGKELPWLAVRGLDDASDLATDGAFARCAVRESGAVVCWGRSTQGEVGWGPGLPSARPVRVPGVGPATDVEFTTGAACSLSRSGEVVCWGLGNRSRHECPRERAARGECWGPRRRMTMVEDAADLAGGRHGFCAARSTGRVVCWGGARVRDDDLSPWSYPPAELPGAREVVALDGAGARTWALDAGGRMSFWGAYFPGAGDAGGACEVRYGLKIGTPWQIAGGGDIVALARECGLRSDGGVACWHGGSELEPVAGLPPVEALIPGWAPYVGTCARDRDGEVWCWHRGAAPVRWAGFGDPFRHSYRRDEQCPMRCPAFAQMGWSWAEP